MGHKPTRFHHLIPWPINLQFDFKIIAYQTLTCKIITQTFAIIPQNHYFCCTNLTTPPKTQANNQLSLIDV